MLILILLDSISEYFVKLEGAFEHHLGTFNVIFLTFCLQISQSLKAALQIQR